MGLCPDPTFDGTLRLLVHRYFTLPETRVQVWSMHDEGHWLSLGSSRYFDVKDGFYFTKNQVFPDTGAFAYGASGPLYGPYPQTVPKGEAGNYLVIRRRFLFGPPGVPLAQAKAAADFAIPAIEVGKQ